MDIKKIDVNSLLAAKYNPRKDLQPNDKEYMKIKRSIEEFGYIDPIIINKDFTIIGGHQRAKVLKDLGYTEVDCVVVDLDKTQEKALNVALNKIAGEWDLPLLKDLLQDLDTGEFDVSITGFDLDEIEQLISQIHVEDVEDDNFDVDEALENIEVPITKKGDIWKLGKHRLLCGDATVLADVEKLMAGKKANLIVTDPPYNVDYVGKTKDALKIQNDKLNNENFYKFLLDMYSSLFAVTADGGGIYVFHADTEGTNFRKAMVDSGFKLAQCCVWVKNSMVMGRQDYHWQHEPILYGWKPTSSHNWYTDRKQTTVWNFNRPTVSKEHPTMKPLDLMGYPIKNSSLENCIILDTFGGSGSTLMASEQLNRICYMMELDEKYCDVIIKRFEALTGIKAELITA